MGGGGGEGKSLLCYKDSRLRLLVLFRRCSMEMKVLMRTCVNFMNI